MEEDLENCLHQKLFAVLKKIKSVLNICANDLVLIRKAIKEFISQVKAMEKRTMKVYQNAVWLTLLHKNSSLYVFYSLF